MPKYPTTSKSLLDRIASGDEFSWNEFYDRYGQVVLAVAKCKGLGEHDAEDVLQNVMQDFFKQDKTFKFDPNIAKFRTYFGRIVNAKIADVYRARKKHNEVDIESIPGDQLAAEEEDHDEVFLAEWRKSVISDVFSKLKERVSPDTWQAYEMYVVQNRPVEKVAAYLDCSVNQVYQAKKRCKAMLEEIITELNKKDPELGLLLREL